MKELSVAKFRDTVEIGLRQHFGRYGSYSEFAGQLSVHPERVGDSVTSDTLEFQCDYFSNELKRVGERIGLKTHLAVTDEPNIDHVYLIPDETHNLPDVIVDLTAGQYIRGHSHAFVGTRQALRDIVLHQTGTGKPYSLEEPSDLIEPEEFELFREPTKFFQRKWGDRSIKVQDC